MKPTRPLRLDFDLRLVLKFRRFAITSDGGLLPYHDLHDALFLTDTTGNALADARTGERGRQLLVGLLRQSVFGRLASYEDVNDAERLCDPATRWMVGHRAIGEPPASASQVSRFETKWLSRSEDLAAPPDLPGLRIEKVRSHRLPRTMVWTRCERELDLRRAEGRASERS